MNQADLDNHANQLNPDLSRSLIPLMKEEWTQSVSADEELYQEYWGEYESWWYNITQNDGDNDLKANMMNLAIGAMFIAFFY